MFFYFAVSNVSAATGRSAVAAVSYIGATCGVRACPSAEGAVCDYRLDRPERVVAFETVFPKDVEVPPRWKDDAMTFWNDVEIAAEARRSARGNRYAKEVIAALPNGLSRE